MKRIFWLIPLLMIVVGCNAAPTSTPVPTWTPTVTPNSIRPTSTPPPNVEVVIPPTRVLPATWTPIPDYTETPLPFQDDGPSATPRISATPSPSPTFDYQVPPTPPALRGTVTVVAECANFHIGKTDSSPFFIRVKGEMHLAWTPLSAPVVYWVWIRHPDGRFVVRQAVEKPEISLSNPAGGIPIFNAEGIYPVAIVAFRDGAQICQQLTDVIIVRGN